MWQIFVILFGALISGVMAYLKSTGAIDTGWFLWVSIPFIVSLVIAFAPSLLEDGFDLID